MVNEPTTNMVDGAIDERVSGIVDKMVDGMINEFDVSTRPINQLMWRNRFQGNNYNSFQLYVD